MKRKTRTKKASVIGPIIRDNGALWGVRLKVPNLPFYLDSSMSFRTRDEAQQEAEKWEKRTITVTW